MTTCIIQTNLHIIVLIEPIQPLKDAQTDWTFKKKKKTVPHQWNPTKCSTVFYLCERLCLCFILFLQDCRLFGFKFRIGQDTLIVQCFQLFQ